VYSKQYRLQELIDPLDGRSLIVDTSNGLSLGPLTGLEHFTESVTPLLPWADGIVTSPGQSRKLHGRMRTDAALLLCADWTNAFRNREFVLPPEHIHYLPILDAPAALDLGASALVMHFLLGHEETIDALCLNQVVQRAIEGSAVGMPLIVNVHPIGPRVVLRPKAIQLGVSYALEGGADGIAIPWPGADFFTDICTMAGDVPVWIKPDAHATPPAELSAMISAGAAGFWLDERLFAADEPLQQVQAFHRIVHQAVEV
jgi:DhnA family fructose-bisphosphate aldolase class Ia